MKSILTHLFVSFVVLFVVVPHCFAQYQYVVTELGLLSEKIYPTSHAYGINDFGEVVGESNFYQDGHSYRHAFCYSNGIIKDLGALSGFPMSVANSINNNSQIVGYVNGSSHSKAFLYDKGVMTDIGESIDYSRIRRANSINNRGEIAIGGNCAYLYYNGVLTEIPSPSGYPINESANDINDNGTIVADALDFTGDLKFHYTSYIYSNGKITSFGNPLGYSDTCRSKFSAINNKGQVVGYANDSRGYAHAFTYENGNVKELDKFLKDDNIDAVANDINDRGQIVGKIGISAFLTTSNGPMQKLNDIALLPARCSLSEATAINNLGQIVVNGTNFKTNKDSAYLLTPVGNCQSYQVKQPTCTPIERLAKWNGASWVAVMPNDPSLASKNIHVLINGWAPGLKDFAKNGGQSWSNVDPKTGEVVDNDYATIFTSLAKNVKNLAPDNVVLTYSWIDRSATENPGTNPLLISKYSKESRNGTDEAGGDLLEALRNSCNFSANPNSKLQLFGISHGARVAAWTANELYKQDSIVVDQLTFCDSPEFGPEKIAGGQNNIEQILPSLKLGKDAESTLIDNYDSSILGKFYAGIGVVNVRLHSGSINPGVAHMYAANWYNEASMPLNVSVNNNALAWSPLLGDTYKTLGSSYEQNESSEFVLKDLTINQDLPVESRRSLPLSLLISEGSVSPITNGVCLTENSPAYWHTSFSKDANDTTLEFSYQFLNPGDGDQLGIWIDDELRFIITGSLVGIGLQMSDIDITDLDSGYHILSVALHSYGDVGCSVNITDFTMISVPEPSTLVLLITVLITLFTATKLHK